MPNYQYLLTLNCHPLDQQLFKDLYPYILSLIDDKSVIYNIEYPIDCRNHLHVVFNYETDNPKWDAKRHFANAKFKKYISNSSTKLPSCLDISKIRKNEIQKTIGYCFKDNISPDHSIGNYSMPEITKFIEIYWASKRLEAKSTRPNSDLIQITSKNINSYYEHEKSKDPEINPENFLLKMIPNYTFLNITQNQLNYFKKEQIFREEKTNKNDIINYINKDDDYYEKNKILRDYITDLISSHPHQYEIQSEMPKEIHQLLNF